MSLEDDPVERKRMLQHIKDYLAETIQPMANYASSSDDDNCVDTISSVTKSTVESIKVRQRLPAITEKWGSDVDEEEDENQDGDNNDDQDGDNNDTQDGDYNDTQVGDNNDTQEGDNNCDDDEENNQAEDDDDADHEEQEDDNGEDTDGEEDDKAVTTDSGEDEVNANTQDTEVEGGPLNTPTNSRQSTNSRNGRKSNSKSSTDSTNFNSRQSRPKSKETTEFFDSQESPRAIQLTTFTASSLNKLANSSFKAVELRQRQFVTTPQWSDQGNNVFVDEEASAITTVEESQSQSVPWEMSTEEVHRRKSQVRISKNGDMHPFSSSASSSGKRVTRPNETPQNKAKQSKKAVTSEDDEATDVYADLTSKRKRIKNFRY